MIQRTLLSTIQQSLTRFPAVGLIGSRQVGKTTLVKEFFKSRKQKTLYIDLEKPSDAAKLTDPELFLGQYRDTLVIIDEIQRQPNLFPILRALIDEHHTPGRFLILGSASPMLLKQSSESLAGRIIYHELSPLSLAEVTSPQRNMNTLWLRGGYPNSFLQSSDEASLEWRNAFIQTHLERDIPQLNIHVPAVRLRRFLSMNAHLHGQLWNASQLAKSMGVSSNTTSHYIKIFTDTFILRQLQPYHANTKKRLVKSPKVYVRDSGILHALLNIGNLEQLQSHPVVGFSWEGFVIEQLIGLLPNTWKAYFYRTAAGAEIDCVVFPPNAAPIAIEIKYSLSPSLDKGFWNAFTDLKCEKGYVVYPGSDTYSLQENVSVIPATQLKRIKYD